MFVTMMELVVGDDRAPVRHLSLFLGCTDSG